MRRSIMILGAGPSQVPVIKAARQLGLKVVATDRNPTAAGFKIADSAYPVDITDVSATIKIAKKLGISGILACGDISVPTAAAVAEDLGLPGLRPEIAKIATDKFLLWQRFKQHGVAYPKAEAVAKVEQAFKAAEGMTYPLIVKPSLAFGGSRGVVRINSPEHLATGFKFAQQASRSGLVLIEEFLDGVEHTVESLVYRGRSYPLAISDKVRISNPYCVATSLNYPSLFPAEMQRQMRDIAAKAAEAVGIESGATHIEMITADSELVVIDFGARGGGAGFIPAVIVPHVSGINMIQEMIRIALGLEPKELEPKAQRGAVFRFFNPPPGKVISISGMEEALRIEGVTEFSLDIKEGDVVPNLSTQLQRVGHFVVLADTAEAALAKADKVEKVVKIQVQ